MSVWTEDARQFLESHRVGHLATASGADGPHVIPVCYAIDDVGLYFVADLKPKRGAPRQLRRLENLRADPRAAVVVDDYDDDWTRLAWVLVRGPTHFMVDPSAHAHALTLLRARYAPYRSMPLDDVDAHPIVCLTPRTVRSWRSC